MFLLRQNSYMTIKGVKLRLGETASGLIGYGSGQGITLVSNILSPVTEAVGRGRTPAAVIIVTP